MTKHVRFFENYINFKRLSFFKGGNRKLFNERMNELMNRFAIIVESFMFQKKQLLKDKMELKDFIRKTLIEVCDGIAEARTSIENKYKGNCIIAPAKIAGKEICMEGNKITFDLVIQAENAQGGNISGEGKMWVCNIGGGYKNEISEKKINRIIFDVPFLPQGLRIVE